MKIKVFFTGISFSLVLFFHTNNCAAQKLSISVLGGYNIAPNSSTIGQSEGYLTTTPGGTYVKNVKGSYGEGITYGIGVGYKICKHVVFNVDAIMLYGKKLTLMQDYPTINYDPAAEFTDVNQANAIRINPGSIFTCNDEKKIQPYAKVELVIGVLNRLNVDDTYYGNIEIKNTGGTDLGFGAALGAYYKLSKHLTLLADINGISENHGYTKGVITEDIFDGQNELPNLTVNAKQYIYKDEIDFTSQTNKDMNSPFVQIKQYYPFSSLGVEIGIKYTF